MAEQEKTSILGKGVDAVKNVAGAAAEKVGVKDFLTEGLESRPIGGTGKIKKVPGFIDTDPEDFGPESVEFPKAEESKAIEEKTDLERTVVPSPRLIKQLKEDRKDLIEEKPPTIIQRLGQDVDITKKAIKDTAENIKAPFVAETKKEDQGPKQNLTGLTRKISMEDLKAMAERDKIIKKEKQDVKENELVISLKKDIFDVKKDKRKPNPPSFGNSTAKGYNLVPISDIDRQDPDATADFMYFPMEGQFGYTLKNRTVKQAQATATKMYEYMQTTGASYYTPAIEELNSYTRMMMENRGNIKGMIQVARRERPQDFVNMSKYLEEHDNFGKLPEETRNKMAAFAVNSKYAVHAIPSILHTGIGEAVGGIDSLLGILPMYDGLLTDFYVAGLNKLQGENAIINKMAESSDAEREDLLWLDDNIYWNKSGEVQQLTNNSPKIRISSDEYRNTKELREDPDILTAVIRQWSQDFAVSASVIGLVGIRGIKYSNELAVQARKNLMANGSKTTKDTIYGEMKRMHKRAYEEGKEENGRSITAYLSKYYKDAKVEYAYSPGKFLGEVGFTELGIQTMFKGLEGHWETLSGALNEIEITGYETIDKGFYGLAGATLAGLGTSLAYQKGGGFIIEGAKSLGRAANNVYKFGLDFPGVAQTLKPVVELMGMGPESIRKALESTDPILNLDINPEMRKRVRSMLKAHLKLFDDNPDGGQIMIAAANRNMKLLKDFEEAGLTGEKTDKILMTLGMMMENDVMMAAEAMVFENSQTAVKLDKKMKFLEDAAVISSRRETLTNAIKLSLEHLGEVQLPTQSELNNLKRILQLEQVRLDGENAQLDDLLSNAVMYQVLPLLDDFKFDTKVSTKLMKILDEHPNLKLNKEDLKAVTSVQKINKLARQQAFIVGEAREEFQNRLVKIKGEGGTPIIYSKGTGNEDEVGTLAIENVGQAGRIINYVSDATKTTIENVQDGVRWTYQKGYENVYDKLNNLPEELTDINVTDTLVNINKQARAGILANGKTYLGSINLVIEPSVNRLLQENYAKLARAINDDLEAGGQLPKYEVKDIKKMLDDKISQDPDMSKRLGSVTNLDRVEILNKMKNLNLDLRLNIETFNDIRQFTNMESRSIYTTDRNRYNTLKEIGGTLDSTFDRHVKEVAKKGEDANKMIGPLREGASRISGKNQLTIVAEELAEAEKQYKEMYLMRSRVEGGSLFDELDDYAQRSGVGLSKETPKSKIEKLEGQVKRAFSFEETDKAVPKPVYKSQRIQGKNQQRDFWDSLFAKYPDGDLLYTKIVNTFGSPARNKKGELIYEIPKQTDALYKPFKFFIEQLNTYVSARTARDFDIIERSGGATKWKNKVDTMISKNETFEEILEQVRRTDVPPAILNSNIGDKNFYEVLNVLNTAINKNTTGEISTLGTNMYKNVFKLAQTNEQVRGELLKVQKRLKNAIIEKAPEVAKERGILKSIIALNSGISKNALSPKNAEEYVEALVAEVSIIDGKIGSTSIDKLMEVALKNGMDKKELERQISRIIGVGIMNKFSVPLSRVKWDHLDGLAPEKNKDKLFNVLKGEKDMIMKEIDPQKAVKAIQEKTVDGVALTDFMKNNRPLLIKYLRNGDEETFKKIELIANMSIKSMDSNNAAIALKDATHGMTKFGYNQAMSRIAAVYSGRASIRYPMMEMSFALLQKREAESVAALLTASAEFVDLVYNTMLTGKVDMKKYNPRIIENYVIDALQMTSTNAQAFIETGMELTDEQLAMDAFLNIINLEEETQKRFPFAGKTHRTVGSDDIFGIGGTKETEEYKKIKNKRKSFKRYVAEEMASMVEDVDNPVYLEVYNSIINRQDSPFK